MVPGSCARQRPGAVDVLRADGGDLGALSPRGDRDSRPSLWEESLGRGGHRRRAVPGGEGCVC